MNKQSNVKLSIIEKVISYKKLENAKFNNFSLNKAFIEELKNNISFIKNDNNYPEFGMLRTLFNDSIINQVFNKNEVNHYINQLNNKKVENTLNFNSQNNSDLKFSLSNPVFTSKGNYALIMYSFGSKLHEIGESGVILYKKTDNEWRIIKEFWITSS